MTPTLRRRLLLVSLVLVCGINACGGGASAPTASATKSWSFQLSPGMDSPTPYGAEAQFAFPHADGVHYFVTSPRGGSSLQSSVTVETSNAPAFDYRTNPNNTCGGEATFGLYFERAGSPFVDSVGGPFDYYRWWSSRFPLREGTVQLIADLTNPAAWTNVNGESGAAHPQEFREAVANMGYAGFTFGGGCFFGHGVFVDAGTGDAVFKVNSFF